MRTLIIWKEENSTLPYWQYLSSASPACEGKLEAAALRTSPHFTKEGGAEPPWAANTQSLSSTNCMWICSDVAFPSVQPCEPPSAMGKGNSPSEPESALLMRSSGTKQTLVKQRHKCSHVTSVLCLSKERYLSLSLTLEAPYMESFRLQASFQIFHSFLSFMVSLPATLFSLLRE